MSILLYSKESYLIRGSLFDVWKQFGGAFKESVIDNSLVISFRKKGLQVSQHKKISIYFENEKVGTYIPDIIVNDKILIELKSKPFLTMQDKRQFWYYLRGSEYKVGFLVNFGDKLEIFRRVYDTARKKFPYVSA